MIRAAGMIRRVGMVCSLGGSVELEPNAAKERAVAIYVPPPELFVRVCCRGPEGGVAGRDLAEGGTRWRGYMNMIFLKRSVCVRDVH